MKRLPHAAEVRQAIRSLRRSRNFTAVSVTSLALGIAMSVTMLGVLDALVKPNLPVRHPEELYRIAWKRPRTAQTLPRPLLHTALSRLPAVTAITRPAARQAIPMLMGEKLTVTAPGASLTTSEGATIPVDLFDALGTRPLHGRLFAASDPVERGDRVAVISNRLWQRLYHGEREFAPFVMQVSGMPVNVIGVARPRLDFLIGNEIWLAGPIDSVQYGGIIRVAAGTEVAQLTTMLAPVNAMLAEVARVPAGQTSFDVRRMVADSQPIPALSVGITVAALAILLIGCANIANLQLARGLARLRELAVRVAIGAGRGDVVRLLVTESTIVAVAGGAGGLLLSAWCMSLVRAVTPPEFVHLGFVEPQFSWRVLGAAFMLTGLAAITFGLLPAIRISRFDVNRILQAGAGTGQTRRSRRQYTGLVAVEVAAAMGLAVCAALLAVSVRAFDRLEYGYTSRSIMVTNSAMRDSSETRFVHRAVGIRDGLRALREVAGASLVFRESFDSNAVMTDDTDPARARIQMTMLDGFYVVDADYFRTLGTRVSGPGFASYDDGGTPVAVLDSVAARKLFRGANPVGRMIKLGHASSPRRWLRVVGVSQHIRHRIEQNIDLSAIEPQIYVLDRSFMIGPDRGSDVYAFTILVRPRDDARATLDAIRIRLGGAQMLDEANGRNEIERVQTFIANLFLAFGVTGVLLAMIGVYGVVAHSVAQRTREFGVRIALGAQPVQLIRLVMGEGRLPLLAGLGLGLVLARVGEDVLTYFITGFGDVAQVFVYIAAPVVILAAMLVATVNPALRAARTNVMEAIRSD